MDRGTTIAKPKQDVLRRFIRERTGQPAGGFTISFGQFRCRMSRMGARCRYDLKAERFWTRRRTRRRGASTCCCFLHAFKMIVEYAGRAMMASWYGTTFRWFRDVCAFSQNHVTSLIFGKNCEVSDRLMHAHQLSPCAHNRRVQMLERTWESSTLIKKLMTRSFVVVC